MSRPRCVSLALPFELAASLPRPIEAPPPVREPPDCDPWRAQARRGDRAWSVLDWAAHRTGARYVGVEPDAGGEPVVVRRKLLVDARRALRPFRADLGCTVEPGVLRFSWHGGRGGLALVTRILSEAGARQPDGTVVCQPIGEESTKANPGGCFWAPVLWGGA